MQNPGGILYSNADMMLHSDDNEKKKTVPGIKECCLDETIKPGLVFVLATAGEEYSDAKKSLQWGINKTSDGTVAA